MTDNYQSKLKKLLDTYDDQDVEIKREVDEKKEAHEKFIEKFNELKSTLLTPIFSGFGASLKERGHDYRITSRDEDIVSVGASHGSSLSFQVLLKGKKYSSQKETSFTLTADTYGANIAMHGNLMIPGQGGSGGPRGTCSLSDLTDDYVKDQIMKFLEELFNRKY